MSATPASVKVPRFAVLTYHSINILGSEYHDNDHVALREDLRLLQRMGLPILPSPTWSRPAGERDLASRVRCVTAKTDMVRGTNSERACGPSLRSVGAVGVSRDQY